MLLFSITRAAASVRNDWLEAVGLFLNEPVAFMLLVAAIGMAAGRGWDGRLRLGVALLVAFILVIAIKGTLAVERPCIANTEAVCPVGFSLPSMHAAISFTLMFAFLGRREFPAVFLFALFVSFTRLNIGVHTFEDIAAALPIGFMSFFLADSMWKRWAQ